MADTDPIVKQIRKVKDGDYWYYDYFFLGRTDATEETKALKIDISALEDTPTRIEIVWIKWAVTNGMSVDLWFDHATDKRFVNLSGNGELDFKADGERSQDPSNDGSTGDILLSTRGKNASKGYMIRMRIKYKA